MKAAVLTLSPSARLIDISHSIPPFDLRAGAFVLWAGSRGFLAGAVHIAVVDPGVGGDRRPLALQVGGSFYVGPDNGLFTMIIREQPEVRSVELSRPASASPTFEGRDVFAPAAARLTSGTPLEELGVPAPDLVVLPDRGPSVLWIDNFGNLVTSLVGPAGRLRVGGHTISARVRTFSDASAGHPFCYVGSLGLVEVGIRDGRADRLLGVAAGDLVEELPAS